MIEVYILYIILMWYGIWWPLWCVLLPLNLLQLYLNKVRTGDYFATLRYAKRGE